MIKTVKHMRSADGRCFILCRETNESQAGTIITRVGFVQVTEDCPLFELLFTNVLDFQLGKQVSKPQGGSLATYEVTLCVPPN